MSKQSELRAELSRLNESLAEQGKAILPSVTTDIVSIFAGWLLGKVAGRGSLLMGAALYATGKYQSLHEQMRNKQELVGIDAVETKPALSGFFPVSNAANRVYLGESPLVTLGIGMMIGGSGSIMSLNGTETQKKTISERTKSAIEELKADLAHRLYLDKFKKQNTEQNTSGEDISEKSINGTDEVDLFIAKERLSREMDFSDLDKISNDLEKSAMDFQSGNTSQQPVSTPAVKKVQNFDDDLSGFSSTRIL